MTSKLSAAVPGGKGSPVAILEVVSVFVCQKEERKMSAVLEEFTLTTDKAGGSR